MDPYKTLGVTLKSTLKEIQERFQFLLKEQNFSISGENKGKQDLDKIEKLFQAYGLLSIEQDKL